MALHFCDLQQNLVMGRASCCQFVRLLNDTSRIALCGEMQMKEEPSALNAANLTENAISTPTPSSISAGFMAMIANISSQKNSTSRLGPNSLSQVLVIKANEASALQHHYTTPVYLKIPSDVPEDHVTFMFGILFLVSIAVLCTMFILRITKPKNSYSLSSRYGNPLWDYDLMLWLRPNNGASSRQRSRRRSSLLFFLRGVTCRIGNSHGSRRTAMRNSVSIVSSSSINAIPVYRPNHSPSSLLSTCSSIVPPPAYDELEQLTSSILSNNTSYADRLLQPPIIIDRNNNNNGPIRILN